MILICYSFYKSRWANFCANNNNNNSNQAEQQLLGLVGPTWPNQACLMSNSEQWTMSGNNNDLSAQLALNKDPIQIGQPDWSSSKQASSTQHDDDNGSITEQPKHNPQVVE